jgi:hypothetical protein
VEQSVRWPNIRRAPAPGRLTRCRWPGIARGFECPFAMPRIGRRPTGVYLRTMIVEKRGMAIRAPRPLVLPLSLEDALRAEASAR